MNERRTLIKPDWQTTQRASTPEEFLLKNLPAPKVIRLNPEQLKSAVQTPAEPYYYMANYTNEDGLAIDSVRSGLLDNKGNLWFGTYGGGVSRFDGHSFLTLTEASGLANDAVQAIFQDQSGSIWFGTIGGLSRYDGQKITNFTREQGLASDEVSSIAQDKQGILWIGTSAGLTRFDGNHMSLVSRMDALKDAAINKIAFDRFGNMWIGTNKGIVNYDGNAFNTFTQKDGLIDDRVNDIAVSNDGTLWFATFSGISKYDGTRFTNYTTTNGLIHDSVITIHIDKTGVLWFGTLGGVSSYDGTRFENLTKNNGLPHDSIAAIVEDRTGNLWFATKGGGIAKHQGKSLINYTSSSGLPQATIYNLLFDSQENLWLGTDGKGVLKYDGSHFTSLNESHGFVSNNMYPLFEDQNQAIWFGSTDHGIIELSGDKFTIFNDKQGLVDNYIQTGIVADNGDFWIGTSGGLSRFTGDSFTNYTEAEGLVSNIVLALLEDKKGTLWIGTNGGLSRFDGKGFVNITKANGLPSDQINGLFEDAEGFLWISTGQGLARYDGESFLVLTSADGLPADTVWWTTSTKDSRVLFIGTNKGLAILSYFSDTPDGTLKLEPQNSIQNKELAGYFPRIDAHNINTGYLVNDANQGSFAIDPHDALWFGTGSDKTGLVRFHHSSLKTLSDNPNVHIRQILVDSQPLSFSVLKGKNNPIEEVSSFTRILSSSERVAQTEIFDGLGFSEVLGEYFIPEKLELPFNRNNLTIEFLAIEPNNPQNLRYTYFLEGYDQHWSQPRNVNFVQYGNISEGKYRFFVRAKGPYSDWSTPSVFAFEVHPPWHRTWWAYSGFSALFLLGLYGLYRWRTLALMRRQRELEVLHEATERFLPKDFLALINKQRVQDVELGDSAEVEMTVMFTDIRGFTSLAEELGHHTTSTIISTYMSYMAPIIRKYEGVVGQFLGDGILAFFKPRSKNAVDAAIEMQHTLPTFNKYLKDLGLRPIEIGIGLNQGPAIFSITGEARRLQATIISDDVNLASRVESLNKLYNTTLILTESALDSLVLDDEYLVLLIDRVIVVGKSVPISIYTAWKKPSGPHLDEASHFINFFNRAKALYEQGRFDAAKTEFELCVNTWPESQIANLFIDRCVHFIKTGKPHDWDGTYRLFDK